MSKSYYEKDLELILLTFDGGERSVDIMYDLIHKRISKSRIVYEIKLTYPDLVSELTK